MARISLSRAPTTRHRFKNGVVWRPVALDPHTTLSQCTILDNRYTPALTGLVIEGIRGRMPAIKLVLRK